MPIEELSAPEIKPPEPRPCAHDWRLWVNVYPVTVNPHTDEQQVMLKELQCPHNAAPGARLCYQHMIMYNEIPTHLKDSVNSLIARMINYYSRGLMFEPQLADGTCVFPRWWKDRFS